MKYKIIFLLIAIAINTGAFAQETPPPVAVPPPAGSSTEVKVVNEVIDFPDKEANFKGGPKKMQVWISRNVNYPQEAIEANTQGKVYLSFIVEPNGEVTNVSIERGVDRYLDREAKRLITNMPKWKPGKKDGKKARTRCRLPINFTLN